jgi:carotenoid cleavage dioxygenase-like enzyme
MTIRFPRTPEFSGALYTASRVEADVYDLEIEGELPLDINGTFYQVAPYPQYPLMLGEDIFFNGDGAVMSLRFSEGHVDFKRRYVLTERPLAQREARRPLFGVYRNIYTNDPSVRGNNNSTVNTSVVEHAGVLLALKEDGPPYAMDPVTLETRGIWDFNGQVGHLPFTAHPKFDPTTGDMYGFGYEAKGEATADIVYYEFDKWGKKKKEIWLVVPYACMIHDFAVTDNYVIFLLMPLTSDLERIKWGGRHFEWQPDLDQVFGVLPRTGDAKDFRLFKLKNGFQVHVLNAFDDNGRIYLDIPITSGNVFYFFPQADGFIPPPETLSSQINRVTLDMTKVGNAIDVTPLTSFPCEFPRIDGRYSGKPYRHGYFHGLDPHLPYAEEQEGPRPFQFFNQICHLNTATNQIQNISPTRLRAARSQYLWQKRVARKAKDTRCQW